MKRLRYLLLGLLLIGGITVAAQSNGITSPDANLSWGNLVPATVAYVVDERESLVLGQTQVIQTLEIAVRGGPRKGDIITLEYVCLPEAGIDRLRAGARLYLRESIGPDGTFIYEIATRDRSLPLVWMALAFVGLVTWAGGKRGLSALVGMALSFVVIFGFVLPRVSAGESPVLNALLGCGAAMPFTYYLSHGLNRKTTIALLGSFLGLAITGGLAAGSVALFGLTGIASEEAGFVLSTYRGAVDLRGILLAGMIIGVLGVLDDITVAQSAVVEQLRAANPSLNAWQLYRRAMQVGQDHIASMVNTLVLVYAGASLPLLLLLTDQSLPIAYTLSQEPIIEEIARTLVTSMGLVVSVPLTTLLASQWQARRAQPSLSLGQGE